MKTVSVALVLCLNVGVDPPDVVKTSPCARLECWIDPLSMSPQKALETIGANLQKQYENWQPRYSALLLGCSLQTPAVLPANGLCIMDRRAAPQTLGLCLLFHHQRNTKLRC
ncbi:hypothetical protein AMECASPLE_021918 [Ameca splendens]|uniref:Raptor N-terminal CASPase-like domain-containing protein n=1 Tax=Ameca splendens TaxID=208324 RepID=A0ABV0Z2C3_9TELE